TDSGVVSRPAHHTQHLQAATADQVTTFAWCEAIETGSLAILGEIDDPGIGIDRHCLMLEATHGLERHCLHLGIGRHRHFKDVTMGLLESIRWTGNGLLATQPTAPRCWSASAI